MLRKCIDTHLVMSQNLNVADPAAGEDISANLAFGVTNGVYATISAAI
jgi:hypothetical protein